jgi:CRISPR-associated protein Cas2
MWLFVMFDLPVKSREHRKHYAQFRKGLLALGFAKMQFSVYAKAFPSEDAANAVSAQIRSALPPNGHVRTLAVTDHQFGKMQVFLSKKKQDVEQPAEQICLF